MSQQSAGALSGVFKRSPKPPPKSDHDKDNLPVYPEQSGSGGSVSNKTSSGTLGWIFRNPFITSAQQEMERTEQPSEEKLEKTPAEQQSESMQDIFFDTVSKLNPFRSTPKELSRTLSYQLSSTTQSKDREDDYGGTLDEEKHDSIKSGEEQQDISHTTPKTAMHIRAKTLHTEDQKVAAGSDRTEDDSDEGVVEVRDPTTASAKETQNMEMNTEENKPMKKKVKKKKNPFMPHVTAKGKAVQKRTGATCDKSAESDGQKKSLMEQLNELRLDRTRREEEEEEEEGLEDLMEWWSTVKQWEHIPKDEDMTEKEEARAFALTAEKVQRGIRVFHQLFSERVEGLWQHVIDLRAIADSLDRFSWRTKVAQITGGSTSAVGGIATIAGLALAPVSMGTSLIVTAVGLGVATAGGLTSASAGISNAVNNSMDRKKVERIVEDYQSKMADLNKCMKFIKQGIENLRKFNLLKVKKQAYNRDFPGLGNIYEDGAMAGKAVLINANELMRVVQIANVAGSTAARAVQIASMATGVLTGLFVGMDIYFVAKDSQELKKGAKSEFAAKIREVSDQLHEGLVELNSIREELQSSGAPSGTSVSAPSSSKQEEQQSSETPSGNPVSTPSFSKQEEQQSLGSLSGTSFSTTTASNQEELQRSGIPTDTPISTIWSSNQEELQSSRTPSVTFISTISASNKENQSSGPTGDIFLMTTISSTQEEQQTLETEKLKS